ncbi:MAG: type IV pilus modification PilV family protein [Bacillota bacterium]
MGLNKFFSMDNGFSLIEIMIAVVIISIAGVAILSVFTGSMRLFNRNKQEEDLVELADFTMEQARAECLDNGIVDVETVVANQFDTRNNNQYNNNYSLEINTSSASGIAELAEIEVIVENRQTNETITLRSMAWNKDGNLRKSN